jgi:hypothetical protein
VYLVGLHIYL